MKKTKKLLVFIIGFFLVLTSLIIYRYEKIISKVKKEALAVSVPGGTPAKKEYTASEIIQLIKASKEYIGDSITIFDNGEMISSNGKFQGTINAVINSDDNLDIVKGAMQTNKLPYLYNVYILAAAYYRMQYTSEFPAQK